MKCFQCKKEFYHPGILLNQDGDFVCSKECEKKFNEERNYFLNVIIHDEEKLEEWWHL